MGVAARAHAETLTWEAAAAKLLGVFEEFEARGPARYLPGRRGLTPAGCVVSVRTANGPNFVVRVWLLSRDNA